MAVSALHRAAPAGAAVFKNKSAFRAPCGRATAGTKEIRCNLTQAGHRLHRCHRWTPRPENTESSYPCYLCYLWLEKLPLLQRVPLFPVERAEREQLHDAQLGELRITSQGAEQHRARQRVIKGSVVVSPVGRTIACRQALEPPLQPGGYDQRFERARVELRIELPVDS